mmetsp:Transcript_52944/g.151620  ORF Transcript_52944/g.151620 Transcript_52944/m.151620 type:complete len:257 (+) Transcript_52944:443-1213(+)
MGCRRKLWVLWRSSALMWWSGPDPWPNWRMLVRHRVACPMELFWAILLERALHILDQASAPAPSSRPPMPSPRPSAPWVSPPRSAGAGRCRRRPPWRWRARWPKCATATGARPASGSPTPSAPPWRSVAASNRWRPGPRSSSDCRFLAMPWSLQQLTAGCPGPRPRTVRSSPGRHCAGVWRLLACRRRPSAPWPPLARGASPRLAWARPPPGETARSRSAPLRTCTTRVGRQRRAQLMLPISRLLRCRATVALRWS